MLWATALIVSTRLNWVPGTRMVKMFSPLWVTVNSKMPLIKVSLYITTPKKKKEKSLEWLRQRGYPPHRLSGTVKQFYSSSEGNNSSQHFGQMPEIRSSRWFGQSSGRASWINILPERQVMNFSKSTSISFTSLHFLQGTATTEVMVNMYCAPPFIPQNTTFFREQGDGLYGTGAGNRTLHAKATLTVRLSLGKGCQRDLSSRPNQFHEAHSQGSLILVQPFPV